jgi:hypothetical protein
MKRKGFPAGRLRVFACTASGQQSLELPPNKAAAFHNQPSRFTVAAFCFAPLMVL